jgi:hypothetical protein
MCRVPNPLKLRSLAVTYWITDQTDEATHLAHRNCELKPRLIAHSRDVLEADREPRAQFTSAGSAFHGNLTASSSSFLMADQRDIIIESNRLLHYGHVLKCGPRSWRTKTATAESKE